MNNSKTHHPFACLGALGYLKTLVYFYLTFFLMAWNCSSKFQIVSHRAFECWLVCHLVIYTVARQWMWSAEGGWHIAIWCAGANGGLVADTIFISNLPENVTEESLAGLLSDTGAIKVSSCIWCQQRKGGYLSCYEVSNMDAVAAVGCTTMYLFFYVVCCVVGKYLESF